MTEILLSFIIVNVLIIIMNKEYDTLFILIIMVLFLYMVALVIKKIKQVNYISGDNNFDEFKSSNLTAIINLNKNNYSDPLYKEIIDFTLNTKFVSASLLQRRFRLGYNRAAKIIDLLEEDGIIGSQIGAKPRNVLVEKVEYIDSKIETRLVENNYKLEEASENHKKLEATLNNEEVLTDILNKLGIKPNYSNDGKSLKYTKNILMKKAEDYLPNRFINKFIAYNTPKVLKLILIDKRIDFIEYSSIPHLLTPILKEDNKIKLFLTRINAEIEKRYNLLSYTNYKNIYDYNENNDENFVSDIYIIINEAYDVLKNLELRDLITSIAMSEGKLGIKIIAFTKFNKKI